MECEAIVADYFSMLDSECRGQPYVKKAHRDALRKILSKRSDGSIEFKHQNISAVLIRADHVYIKGYKPAWNYQELLADVVLERLSTNLHQLITAEDVLIQRVGAMTNPTNSADVIVAAPPDRRGSTSIREQRARRPIKANYTEREARNRRLGESGESFVLSLERLRLSEMGRTDLVDEVEWSSKDRGDGLGYDIRSFSGHTDDEKFIEVKTTNAGIYQPFFMSANEVTYSGENPDQYSLYRVFDFAEQARVFVLDGNVSDQVSLTAVNFRATV